MKRRSNESVFRRSKNSIIIIIISSSSSSCYTSSRRREGEWSGRESSNFGNISTNSKCSRNSRKESEKNKSTFSNNL